MNRQDAKAAKKIMFESQRRKGAKKIFFKETLINSLFRRMPESSALVTMDYSLRSPFGTHFVRSMRVALLSDMRGNNAVSIILGFLEKKTWRSWRLGGSKNLAILAPWRFKELGDLGVLVVQNDFCFDGSV